MFFISSRHELKKEMFNMPDISKIDSNFTIQTNIEKKTLSFIMLMSLRLGFMEFSKKMENTDECLKILREV